jgi:oxygen-independent coproporphyrinogen-3 oxidase
MPDPTAANGRGNGLFGVYVHWPFCLAKCPYCDFNSHVHRGAFDEAGYVAAYDREIAWFAERTPGRTVQSIFFGGGTPSLMSPRAVGAILDSIGRHWAIDSKVEITLEANPTSVEADRFRGYRAAGVNRVSLGVQSLRPQPLAELGRRHTVEEAEAAVRLAQSIFPRSSFDLI